MHAGVCVSERVTEMLYIYLSLLRTLDDVKKHVLRFHAMALANLVYSLEM